MCRQFCVRGDSQGDSAESWSVEKFGLRSETDPQRELITSYAKLNPIFLPKSGGDELTLSAHNSRILVNLIRNAQLASMPLIVVQQPWATFHLHGFGVVLVRGSSARRELYFSGIFLIPVDKVIHFQPRKHVLRGRARASWRVTIN